MDKKIKKYFERLQLSFDENAPLDYSLLKKIQYAHVTKIPYENIDILKGIPLTFDYDKLYEKIVINNRGGYCFELNGLLGWLLRALGFEVVEYMARYLKGEKEIPMRRHRVLKVKTFDGNEYLCDAGVGAKAPKEPLILATDLIQEQHNETYRFVKTDFFGYVLQEKSNSGWIDVFAFTQEVQLNKDFVMPSFYCEKHPDSIFNKTYMISIKTRTGRKTIDDLTFKVFEGDELSEKKELSENEIASCLKENFGIIIDNLPYIKS